LLDPEDYIKSLLGMLDPADGDKSLIFLALFDPEADATNFNICGSVHHA